MKSVFTITVILFTGITSQAQKGYIKYKEDSLVMGFVRVYAGTKNRQPFFELWRTKNDKQPLRIYLHDIHEYSIKEDTFLILKNFRPFSPEDIIFEFAEAKIIQSGKIQLLNIKNPFYRAPAYGENMSNFMSEYSPSMEQQISKVKNILVLREPSNNYLRAVPKKTEMFNDLIADFFHEKAITSFEKNVSKLKFGTLEDFVEYYNAKMAEKR